MDQMKVNCFVPDSSKTPPILKNVRFSSKGGNAIFSIFVGTTLLTIPFSNLTGNIELSGDYSSSSCINYVNIGDSREDTCLNNSSFLDLLKMENHKKLECMSSFKENWNGTGGQAFSDSSINLFKNIIENICKQPYIAPTGRGSLLLQYELDDQSVLAFEVRENKLEMACVPKGNYSLATNEIFTDNFIEHINSQVAQFYGLKQN